MESKDTTSKVEEQGLKNLQSDYFIQKFFGYMPKRKSLEIIRYNKNIQKRIKRIKKIKKIKTKIKIKIKAKIRKKIML